MKKKQRDKTGTFNSVLRKIVVFVGTKITENITFQ